MSELVQKHRKKLAGGTAAIVLFFGYKVLDDIYENTKLVPLLMEKIDRIEKFLDKDSWFDKNTGGYRNEGN